MGKGAQVGEAHLQMVSPMMVERRWPTCISFATFGDEKSTTTRLWMGATMLFTPFFKMPCTCAASHARESLMLMKPGPASLQAAANVTAAADPQAAQCVHACWECNSTSLALGRKCQVELTVLLGMASTQGKTTWPTQVCAGASTSLSPDVPGF